VDISIKYSNIWILGLRLNRHTAILLKTNIIALKISTMAHGDLPSHVSQDLFVPKFLRSIYP